MAKVPQIRFKGFEGEWEKAFFKDLTTLCSEKNRDNLPLVSYSITNDNGFVPQNEKFEKGGLMINADKSVYYIVTPNTFAYNPARINVGSIGYYEGTEDVIVSSLYILFKTCSSFNNHFLMKWFKSPHFNRLVHAYEEGGVRLYYFYDKLCKTHVFFPSIEEQSEVATFFTSFDVQISYRQKELEKLISVKKALQKQMFPNEGEPNPKVRFKGFDGEWAKKPFGSLLNECFDRSEVEDEDVLLSCAIEGMFLNSELFSHQRGASNKGYRKIRKNMMVLSAQNLHLGNANVNLRFDHGLVSPAYKIYDIVDALPEFMSAWIKKDDTKAFFDRATTVGASGCRKNIEWNDLYKQEFKIPDGGEQDKIAKLFMSLDRLITARTAQLTKLQNLKRGMLERMFVNE